MNTTLTSRVLAGSTVAGALLLGYASGVFGTFSTTILSGQTCSGYGYFAGYGYGYDCTPSSGGGGGGGGGSSTSTSPVVVTPTKPTTPGTPLVPSVTPPVSPTTPTSPTAPAVVLFPEFTPNCSTNMTSLTDPRLKGYYSTLGVTNTSNVNRTLTRAEFVKLVLNAAGVNVSRETAPNFSDVPSSHSLAKYIAYAARNGIVSGQNGKFRPNDSITRAEATKVLVNAAGILPADSVATFRDVVASSSLGGYVQAAYDNCLLQGRAPNVFQPNSGITLAETAKILFNINPRTTTVAGDITTNVLPQTGVKKK